jgi:hypothetical protein
MKGEGTITCLELSSRTKKVLSWLLFPVPATSDARLLSLQLRTFRFPLAALTKVDLGWGYLGLPGLARHLP